jgi:hypothetical protein
MANSEPDIAKEPPRPAEACTLLRQGSVIPTEVCRKLNIAAANSEREVLIVASHDCDCVKSKAKEPYIEAMFGTIIDAANGNFTNAKNARTLHLELTNESGPITVEIVATPKIAIPKEELETIAPSEYYEISERQKKMFSIWLRSRYSRAALPNELVERLRVVEDSIEDAGKANPYAIHGIYLFHDPLVELGPTENYEVQITVVYDTLVDDAQSIAEAAATKIKRRFEMKFQKETPGMGILWKGVYLSKCEAVADTEFTFAEMLDVQQFQLDHISLRGDPQAGLADPT